MKKHDWLHKNRTRHTNILIPRSDFVSGSKYPEQDTDMLGEVVSIRYRSMYHMEVPEELRNEIDRIEEPENDILTSDFYIIRKDISEPYKMVSVSKDFKIILVQDSRVWEEQVAEYPIQYNEFCGITVHNKYFGDSIPQLRGVTIRVDNGEPCYTVIFEFYEDNSFRVVLGDECFSELYDQYYSLDLNGVNPEFDPTDPSTYIDIDGWYPKYYELYKGDVRNEIIEAGIKLNEDISTYKRTAYYDFEAKEEISRKIEEDQEKLNSLLNNLGNEIDWVDIDGGLADLLKYIYTTQLNDNELVLLRKELIGGYKIYGTNKIIET